MEGKVAVGQFISGQAEKLGSREEGFLRCTGNVTPADAKQGAGVNGYIGGQNLGRRG